MSNDISTITKILITDGAETDWSFQPVTVLSKFNRIRISQLGKWGLPDPGVDFYSSVFFIPNYQGYFETLDLFADNRELMYSALFTASIPKNMTDFTHELPTFPEGNYGLFTFPRQKGGLLVHLWYDR